MKERIKLFQQSVSELEAIQLMAIDMEIKRLKRQHSLICFMAGLVLGIMAVLVS